MGLGSELDKGPDGTAIVEEHEMAIPYDAPVMRLPGLCAVRWIRQLD